MKHNINAEEVIARYKSGMSIYQVAKKLGIGKSTAHRILKENNIPTNKKQKKKRQNAQQICDYYVAGNSAIKTAVEFGVSPSEIYRILKCNDIKSRSLAEAEKVSQPSRYISKSRSQSVDEEWLRIRFVDQKMTCGEISDKYGINISTLNYYKRKFGIKRPPEQKAIIQSRISKRLWKDDNYKNQMSLAIASTQKVSVIQEALYSMLDDLQVAYYREYNDKEDDVQCRIGPYSFDCVVPRDNRPTLLIEVQGEYWHSLKRTIEKDVQKASYISNNFQGQYELKYIWEHEFSNKNHVLTSIKHWLGLEQPILIDFDFADLQIRKSPRSDYKLLLSKYHYLANAGRGGISYGAYLGDKLIAVCIFSPPIRQNVDDSQNTRELSRFCINPSYQKKNFASWFISRCIKKLPKQYSKVTAYSDTTFEHYGTIYLAANFKQVSTIKPDYWYSSPKEWIMHKRTLYGRAKAMAMTEKEYATKHSYKKVYGKEKLKFLYER